MEYKHLLGRWITARPPDLLGKCYRLKIIWSDVFIISDQQSVFQDSEVSQSLSLAGLQNRRLQVVRTEALIPVNKTIQIDQRRRCDS